MLQNFRDNLNGAAKVILVAIIIVPFALFGVDALFVGGDSIQEAANVNGEPISERTLQQAVLVQKQQIINRFKEVDPALIDEEKLRPAVMQRLIRQKVEEQAAIDLGMGLSKSTVYDLLAQIPEFQTDGKFDAQRYDFVVRQMGYTPTTHNKAIRSELLVNQFLQGVVATGFTTEKELELLASMVEQTRDYYYLTIPAEPLKKTLEVSADEAEAYYKSNSAQFMTEEKLVVEYIELQPSDLLSEISVDDDLVDERYEEKIQALKQGAARHSAHILLEKQDDGSHLEKMAEIQKKINNGEDFAVLAKEYSEDYATSEQGGDLGYTQSGDLPEALDSALDHLAVGEVSAVVETKAGVHLIKLIDKRASDIPDRDELEPSIREELALQIAQERLPERIEALKDLSYNATSLQDTADQMALDLKVSEPFTRAGGSGIAANTLVVNAAYSDSVLVEGYASDVIELSDNKVVVLAIRERLEPRLKALDEVKDQIEHVMKAEKVNELLLAKGEELQAQVKSGSSIEEVAKAEGLAWQVSLNTKRLRRDQGDPIRRQVFALPVPDKEPVVDYLLLPNGDYVLVSLVKVEEGDYRSLSLEQKQALFASRSMATAGRDYQAYGSLLLSDAEVVSNY
jgi:peptidyl-prolyl cis-trans isomerase D